MELYLEDLESHGSLQNNTPPKSSTVKGNMALSGKQTTVNCRLCLVEIHDSNVTLLDGIIKDMLEIILPELNLTICENSSICEGCLETLKQSYSFKSSCLEVEDRVQDFVNPKKPTLIDLKEVLKRTNDIKQISGNLIVCRTCLGLGEESLNTKLCSYEGDPLQNMVEKCLPEMGLNLTKDPSICPMCLEQLEEQFHFIMQCLDTEAKINYYCERKRVFKDVDLQNVYLFSICLEEADDLEKQFGTPESLGNGNCVREAAKREDSPTKTNFNVDQPMHNIKKEDFVDLTDNPLLAHAKHKIESFNGLLENSIKSSPKKPRVDLFTETSRQKLKKPKEEVTFQIGKDGNGEDVITSLSSQVEDDNESDSDMSVTKESELLAVKKVIEARESSRKGRQKNPPPKTNRKHEYKYDDEEKSEEEPRKKRRRTQKCKVCEFKTKFSSRMKAHMTVNHKGKVVGEEQQKTEDKSFKCRICTYKTLNKGEYKDHKREHRKEKEQKCPQCTMVFVRMDFLKKHIESHGALKVNNVNALKKTSPKPSEVPKQSRPLKQPTNCNMTKAKNLKNTFSFHGQVLKMFKCRLCPYQTRLKSNYDKHGLTHKKTTEIKTHRCKICNFETIQKENFMAHMQSHENEGENKVMKCFLCSYQPTTELALRQHVNQAHKSGTG